MSCSVTRKTRAVNGLPLICPRRDGGTEVTESFRMNEGLMTTLFGLFGGQLRKRRNMRDMRKTLERIKAVVEV